MTGYRLSAGYTVIVGATLLICAGTVACSGTTGSAGGGGSGGCVAPCGQQNGVTVTISGVDLWYDVRASGYVGGPKFVWHVKNDTNDTIGLNDFSGFDLFDSNHAEVIDPVAAGVTGQNDANGCPARSTMRIPPHQTVSSPGPVCLGVRASTTASLVEFQFENQSRPDAATVDVPLPSSYGTSPGECPSDQVLQSAIASDDSILLGLGGGATIAPSAVRLVDRFCKGAYAIVTADDGNGPQKYVVYVSNGQWQVSEKNPSCTRYPRVFTRALGC